MQGTGYCNRIAVCHGADLDAFEPWYVGDAAVGRVHRERVPSLRADAAFATDAAGVLRLRGDDFAARSRHLAEVVDRLCDRGELRAPLGEMYAVVDHRGGAALAQIDRTAVTWFGVRAAGVHLTGYVPLGAGDVDVWIAERSRGKRTFPGHLDNTVAGGQPIGLDARATLVKECAEEAAIPADLAARARFVGTIRYAQQDGRSLKVDSLACFDLELPASFVPVPHDGEVERFHRWSAGTVADSLRGDGTWKPNCALVALHFLLRHGLLDRELGAAERWLLWQRLHGELP